MFIRKMILMAVAVSAFASVAPSSVSAQIVTINPAAISACTRLVSGDREFAGHGPRTSLQLNLRLASNPTVFYMDLHMDQQETASNWSTGVAERNNIPIATSPGATHFTHVWKPDSAGNWGWVAIGPGLFWNTGLTYTDTNTSLDVFNNWDWWIQSVNIMGDTPGNDITDTCLNPSTDSGVVVNYNRLFLFAS